jgi:quercetin dioxygenase-like cupin family protein
MKKLLLILLLVGSPLIAQDAKVTSLMTKPLQDFPGKEVQILSVKYPPGGQDPVHRHNAHGFIYVLEGTIVMAVNGGQPVTVTAGQMFYEGPNNIHTIGRNASKTTPARFCGVPAQRQRCACSDSGEVGLAHVSPTITGEPNHLISEILGRNVLHCELVKGQP